MTALALLVACSDYGLDPIDAEGPEVSALVEDRFVQAGAPAVDVLFVVDDTPSMAAEQSALGTSFGALASALAAADVRWQVGVTTTTMVADPAGWLLGAPYVLASSTPDAEFAVGQRLVVGLGGSGPEAGIAAALRALELSAGGPNRGFRRPNAALHVVFVSDGDDRSDEWLGTDPLAELIAVINAEGRSAARPARVHAITGPAGGCTSDVAAAGPAPRYLAAVSATGGTWTSICEADSTALVSRIAERAVTWSAEFPLSATPVDGRLTVKVDGAPIGAGWVLATDPARLVFDAPPREDAEIIVRYLAAAGT